MFTGTSLHARNPPAPSPEQTRAFALRVAKIPSAAALLLKPAFVTRVVSRSGGGDGLSGDAARGGGPENLRIYTRASMMAFSVALGRIAFVVFAVSGR